MIYVREKIIIIIVSRYNYAKKVILAMIWYTETNSYDSFIELTQDHVQFISLCCRIAPEPV